MIERVVVSVRREQPGGVDFGCAVMVSVPAGSGNDTATMTAGMGLEGLRRSFLAFWCRGSEVAVGSNGTALALLVELRALDLERGLKRKTQG